MQDEQFGLGLLALQVKLTHATQLLKRFVDVTHSQPLSCVVGHSPLAVPFRFLFRVQIVVFVDAAVETERKTRYSQTHWKSAIATRASSLRTYFVRVPPRGVLTSLLSLSSSDLMSSELWLSCMSSLSWFSILSSRDDATWLARLLASPGFKNKTNALFIF